MQFRRDIQGMRAIAVLAVFIFHLNPAWLPGGFIGVDIFFVISGYLISSIILSRMERDKFSFLEFYGSRIKRITPAYYIMLLIIMLITTYISFGFDINTFRLSFKSALLFISNMYFSSLDTYFGAQNAENPFLHTWTLAIEMQFYLFLPFILFFVRSRKWLLPIVIILTIGLFAYGSIEIFALHNKNAMYFSLLARAPEFLLGVIVSLIPADRIKLGEKGGLALSVLGLMLIIGSTIFITEHSAFPGILAAVPCVGAALIIIAPQNKIRSVLAMEVPFLIGDWSYSIYLWHWPVMALMRYYYSVEIFTLWQYIFVIISTIILSLASYYLIEHPLRKTKGRILYPIVAVLFVGCFALNRLALPLNQKYAVKLDENYTTPVFGIYSHGKQKLETFGDLSKKSNILLTGNSHARVMKAYLNSVGKKYNFSFNTITVSSIPPLEGIKPESLNSSQVPLYANYKIVMDFMKSERFIENSQIILFSVNLVPLTTDILEDYLSDFIEKLRSDQIFILLSDFPYLDKHPIKTNRSITKTNNENIFRHSDTYISDNIKEIIDKYPNAHILDLTQTSGYKRAFNDAPFYNDTVMYYDEDHLNLYGSLMYAQETEKDFMHKLDSILSLHKDIKLNVDSVR